MTRPIPLKASIFLAWVGVGLSVLGTLVSPWAILLAIPFAVGALGLQADKAGHGFGLALWLGALAVAGWMSNDLEGLRTAWAPLAVLTLLLLCLAALFLAAGKIAQGRRPGTGQIGWGWMAASIGWIAFFAFFRTFLIPTGAMERTILIGDRLLVKKAHGETIRRGEAVVFRCPVDRRQIYIKRVVAGPGDRLRVQHKMLRINGQPVDEPFAVHQTSYEDSYRDNFPAAPNTRLYPEAERMLRDNVMNGELVVPANKYFVMGDNRDNSLDSRYWGFIEAGDVVGRPVLVYFSAAAPADNAPGGDEPFAAILHARWDRFLRPL